MFMAIYKVHIHIDMHNIINNVVRFSNIFDVKKLLYMFLLNNSKKKEICKKSCKSFKNVYSVLTISFFLCKSIEMIELIELFI